MKQQKIEQLKRIINDSNALSLDEKVELYGSLEVFASYSNDLNKCSELTKLVSENYQFLKEDDGKNREDKLLENYGLTRESTKEEIIKKRDYLLDNLYKKSKNTKYIDKAKRFRKQFNIVKEEFQIILDRYDHRVLAGDIKDRNVKIVKRNALLKYGELVDKLSQYAIETKNTDELVDHKAEVFNYVYDDMSDSDIRGARNDINSRPISFASSSDNNKEYLEPIEYIPNTNIRKPRNRGVYESDEHYASFLQEYYSRYNFDANNTKKEETEEFYGDKLKYIESSIQKYFDKVREAVANLRWMYNYSLNKVADLNDDISFYYRKIVGNPSKRLEFTEQIRDAKDSRTFFKEFIKEYEEKLDSINTITGTLYNEPTLVGDCTLSIELIREGNSLNAKISPLVTLIDDEKRKKYGNYAVDAEGNIKSFSDYSYTLDTINNESIDKMLSEFAKQVIDEQLIELDIEMIKKSNVEVNIDGKIYVMPYEDLGENLSKVLSTSEYKPKETYKTDEKVTNYVNNIKKNPIGVPEPAKTVTEPVKPAEPVKPKEEQTKSIPVSTNKQVTDAPKTIFGTTPVQKPSTEVQIENSLIEEKTKEAVKPTTSASDIVSGQLKSIGNEVTKMVNEEYHKKTEPETKEEENTSDKSFSKEIILDGRPLTESEKKNSIKVIASRTPVNFVKTVAAGMVGGALAIYGLLSTTGLAVFGGVSLLGLSGVNNLKNLSRSIQKHKVKQIAKHHNAKAYFGDDGKVKMKKLDGTEFTKEQNDLIQKEIDKKINFWLDKDVAPRVTLDNLEHAFMIDANPEVHMQVTKKEATEYNKYANNATKFEDIDADIDLFGKANKVKKEDTIDAQIERKKESSKDVQKRVTDELLGKLSELNPGIAEYYREDGDGFYFQVPNPDKIVIPEGYQYIPGVGINNNQDPNAEAQVEIAVFPTMKYGENQQVVSDAVIDEAIQDYGFNLHDIDDAGIEKILADGKYSYEEIKAAADRFNSPGRGR